MSLIKKLAGETMIYGVSSILSRLLNYVILTPYFTRVFVDNEYGVVSEMYAYAALLMVFFTYRMETTFFRFASEKDQLNKTFSTASISLIISTIVFVGGMLLFAQPLADMLSYPQHTDYVQWFIFIIALDTLAAIPFARLRLENRPISFAIVKTLNIIVNIIFIFFFLELCPFLIKQGYTFFEKIYDPNNRIAYVFISNFIGSLSVMLILLPEYKKLSFRFDITLWKKMIWYALPLVVVGIAAVTNQLINLPLQKHFLSGTKQENLSDMGVYAACAKLAILMSLFIQAFNYAAEPFFFRNADRSDSKKVYAQVGQAFALVGSLVFLGITLYIDVVKLFIGEGYHRGLGMVPVLTMAFLFLGLYYNFSIWYKLSDRTSIGAYISIGGAIITVVMNVLLLPVIGYYASAWTALACYSFMALASYAIGQKYYPIPYPVRRMFLYIGLAIAIYYFSTLLRGFLDDHFGFTLLGNTALLAFFLGLIYMLEKEKVLRLFKSGK